MYDQTVRTVMSVKHAIFKKRPEVTWFHRRPCCSLPSNRLQRINTLHPQDVNEMEDEVIDGV